MSNTSLFDIILDILFWPRWSPWLDFVDIILDLLGITDSDGTFMPRKKPVKLRKGTEAYEWQLDAEEAGEWARRDPKVNEAWLVMKPALMPGDTIYTFTGLAQDGGQTQGLAILRGTTCIWRRHIAVPFDPDAVYSALRSS